METKKAKEFVLKNYPDYHIGNEDDKMYDDFTFDEVVEIAIGFSKEQTTSQHQVIKKLKKALTRSNNIIAGHPSTNADVVAKIDQWHFNKELLKELGDATEP